jgi:hypothetical protein
MPRRNTKRRISNVASANESVVYAVFSEEPCECEVHCNCAQATLLEIYKGEHKDQAEAHAARTFRGEVRAFTLQ